MRQLGDEDENDVIMNGYEKSGVRLASFGDKTSYRCDYTPDRDLYLPYWG